MGRLSTVAGRNVCHTEAHGPIVTRWQRGGAVFMAIIIAFGLGPFGARAQPLVEGVQPPSYAVDWPPDPSALQAAAEADVEQAEKEVHALIAAEAPDFAAASSYEKLDRAIINANLVFQRIVKPRLENAALGCREARLAVAAWFSYWRPLQEAGIDDDKNVFPIVDGVPRTNSFDLPDRFYETLVSLCATEAYDRCVATGDFPAIFEPLVGLQRIWEVFLGRDMPQRWVDAFVRYARQCGQWTLNIKSEFTQKSLLDNSQVASCCGVQGKMHRDITLRWEPNGSGLGKIYNSTIVGEGDVLVDAFELNGNLCEKHVGASKQAVQAKAKLTGLVFTQGDYGPIAPWSRQHWGSPAPRHVWLEIQFGDVETEYSARCPYHQDVGPGKWPADEFELAPLLLKNGDAASVEDLPELRGLLITDNRESSSSPAVASLWTFSSNPFRADLDIHRTDSSAYVFNDARLTLRLTHTPH